MQMFALLAFVLLVLSLAAKQTCGQNCNYYTLTPGRTNYSTWTAAYAATNGLETPIHVCNGAVVYPNETISAILNNTIIIGDIGTNGVYAVWTIMVPQTPVFFISGLVTMSVQTINIFFIQTLFYIDIHATLLLENTLTWDGNVTVFVSGSTGYGMGLTATNTYFGYVGVGIQFVKGTVYCTNCIFVAERSAGIISPDTTLTNIYLIQPVFVNTIFPIATLLGTDVNNGYLQLLTPTNLYVLQNRMITCRDYPTYQAPVIYNCSGSGTVGLGTTNTIHTYSETNEIIAWVIFGLMLAVAIGVIVAYVVNQGRTSPATPSA